MKRAISFFVAAVLTTGLIGFEKNLKAQNWRPKNQFGKTGRAIPKNAAGNIQNATKQGSRNTNQVPNLEDSIRPVGDLMVLPSCPNEEATYPSNAELHVNVSVADEVIMPFGIRNYQDDSSGSGATPSPILNGHYGSDHRGSIADFSPSSDSSYSPYLVPLQHFGTQGSDYSRIHSIDVHFVFKNDGVSECPVALLRARAIQANSPNRWYETQNQSVESSSSDSGLCFYDATVNTTSLFVDVDAPRLGVYVPIEFCAADATHIRKNRIVLTFFPRNDIPGNVYFLGGAQWIRWRNDAFSRRAGSSQYWR